MTRKLWGAIGVASAVLAGGFTTSPLYASEDVSPLVDLVLPNKSDMSAVPSPALLAELETVREASKELDPAMVTLPWLDPVDGEITLGIVSEAKSSPVMRELAETKLDEAVLADIELLKVEHSQEVLDDIVQNVYSAPGMESITSAYRDYANNRAILTTEVEPTDELRGAIYSLYGNAAALESVPVPMSTMNADYSRFQDRSSFFGGARYYQFDSEGRASRCTAGFSWSTGTGGHRMVTAGHCVPRGGTRTIWTGLEESPTNYRWGNRSASTWESGTGTLGSNGDLALINGTEFDRKTSPRMWTGGTYTTTSTVVTSVDEWTENGQAVCYSGIRRGVQCGAIDSDGNGGYTVTDKDASYKDSNTQEQVNNVALATKGWGACTRGGDSGSPVYVNTPGTGIAAHGILSGGGGGGGDDYVGKYEPSNCRMFFTEIGQAYQEWPEGWVKTTNP